MGIEHTPEFLASLLRFAIRNRDIAAVQRLVASGADVNARSHGGNTPLMTAAEEGLVDIARVLLDKGAEINACDVRGDTPLIRAAFSGGPEIVRLLLERGADPDIRGDDGRTAQHWAECMAQHDPDSRAGEAVQMLKKFAEDRRRIEAAHRVFTQRQALLKKIKPRTVLKP
jgi:hypothetical protein